MADILVLGATGYIGGRLVPRLVERGHNVRCLVRNPRKLAALNLRNVRVFPGDALNRDSLRPAMEGVDTVFYLVHSMAAGEKEFEERDRAAARNVADVACEQHVRRIIYLGGLGRKGAVQSAHLRSRHEVGDILRSGGVPVTEFRAAVIVGSGSASFEMMHHLVNRLPVMICPRWVAVKTQPIAIGDVLSYLLAAVERDETTGRTIDIGGPEVLSYRDMMMTVARVLGLKRFIILVPVLTPRLSSYWVNFVTPIPISLARSLIESLRSETICEEHSAEELFPIKPKTFEQAVRRALEKVRTDAVETTWTFAENTKLLEPIDPSHLRTDVRTFDCQAPARSLFAVISAIGGDRGWYYANWLWGMRGFIDKQTGGVGLRRGRRHPTQLRVGEALDFWRVEELEPDRKLLLRAEMNVWGQAWLDFRAEELSPERSRLVQTARYYPRGLFGLLYWYSILPLHAFVFKGMAKEIVRRAEEQYTTGKPAAGRRQ